MGRHRTVETEADLGRAFSREGWDRVRHHSRVLRGGSDRRAQAERVGAGDYGDAENLMTPCRTLRND
jgi:hypothetical protein